MTEKKTYRICEAAWPLLVKKLTKIQNRCKNAGMEYGFEVVSKEYKTREGETYCYHNVAVSGSYKIPGWEFVGTLEHMDGGNIIRPISFDMAIPERFRTCDAYCEHCQTRRKRKDTYLVRNTETGEIRQVGKTCLMDYTNGMDAAAIAAYYDGCETIDEVVNNEPHGEKYYNVRDFLPYFAEATRIWGFHKTDEGYYRNTRDRGQIAKWQAEEGINLKKHPEFTEIVEDMKRCKFNAENSAETAKNALEWIATQDATSDYISNLKVIGAQEWVTWRDLGLLASLPNAYNRAMEREAKRRAEAEKSAGSEFQGEVGKRITFTMKDCVCVYSWETQFGTTHVYKFTDTDGNIYTWKSGNYVDDNTKTVTGTVKAHNEFRGVKQTELTRCKLAA